MSPVPSNSGASTDSDGGNRFARRYLEGVEMPRVDRWPRVGIVVLNWNGLQDTLECLESLSGMAYTNREIIIVDNGSTDGSPEAIRERYPEVRLLRNARNLGFAGGNNAGIRKALDDGAEMVWVLNNDTIVEKDALSHLVATAMDSEEIGLASPVIRYYDDPGTVQFCGSYIEWEKKRIVHMDEMGANIGNNMPMCLWGTALLIKRSSIDRIGFLDEKYFAYHEDEEYSMRAVRAGLRNVVEPQAVIFHKNSRSTGSNDAPFQVFLRSRNIYFLWMDTLKGIKKVSHLRRYLAHIVSYGGALREKSLPDSVEACLDGVWHAFRGAGGPRNPEITMPIPFRKIFYFLFSWHPYFWAGLLRGDFREIAANLRKRMRITKAIR